MKIIAPSLLSADFTNLANQIRYAEIGGAGWMHCDIMDGHFVPNLTFGPLVVSAVKRCTKLPVDAHLMIEKPDKLIPDFIKAGADYITVHQEEVKHLHRTITMIKDAGVKAGVAINPATPVDTLSEIIEFVDMVLVMSVNPGFGGQKFIPSALGKIAELAEIRELTGLDYLIQVDGGVNRENTGDISKAGCDVLVAGSAVFSTENISAAVMELKNIAEEK